jgi:hypothetical protein
MNARPGFGTTRLRHVAKLLQVARDLTGDHFRLGHDEARRVPAEIRTLADLENYEIQSGEVLAYIARYGYSDPRSGRQRDLYQINLQDHNILDSLERSGAEVDFSPLMLYVLTHELIHVIRFVKFLAPFHQADDSRLVEEQRVHALTQKLLARVPVAGMPKVLDKYRHLAD